MKIDTLTGKNQEHLTPCGSHLIHKDILIPFTKLKESAKKEGFDLKIASAFRSFERQLTIWNEKASGVRPLLDKDEKLIDPTNLSKEEILFHILNWSMLPGASRHHWGTDLDIFDGASLPSLDYKIQLTQEECDTHFHSFHTWLDNNSGDFYRPYTGSSRTYCERWHISYKPIASQFEKALSEELLSKIIKESNILLKDQILSNLSFIYSTYCQQS